MKYGEVTVITTTTSFLRAVLRDAVVLVCLGVVRLTMVWAADYQHHVTEYGVHGNFFFTLAAIKAGLGALVYSMAYQFFLLIISVFLPQLMYCSVVIPV